MVAKRRKSSSIKSNVNRVNKRLRQNVSSPESTALRDDSEGRLIYNKKDVLANQYTILDTLGEGTFGQVLKVEDKKANNRVIALKVVKNDDDARNDAELEIDVLKKLALLDPKDKFLIVRMLHSFDYRGHICIAFEMLGKSVYDFLEDNNFQPYPMDQVRHMAYQLCYSVKFLHKNKLTHTDLKPENMVFVNADYYMTNEGSRCVKNSDIRLIDFGSATFDHEHHSSSISTQHYRAPEAILQLGWHHPCDLWSIGCILYELYTGNPPFTLKTDTNQEHLAMIEHVIGPIPCSMASKTKIAGYFKDGKVNLDKRSRTGRHIRENCKPLADYMKDQKEHTKHLFDLMRRMLEIDVSKRITAAKSLEHAFFKSMPKDKRLG